MRLWKENENEYNTVYNTHSLNEKVNETFFGVYYENPLKRSFFMGLNNQDYTCFRGFLHTGFLKMRELNRRFTTLLKKLTRPICITILWIWGVKFRYFQKNAAIKALKIFFSHVSVSGLIYSYLFTFINRMDDPGPTLRVP